MTTNQAQPTTPVMFVHDGSSIFYPTAPGRVYIIGIIALADCDGSDEDYSDSTSRGDLSDIARTTRGHRYLNLCNKAPIAWPTNARGINDEGEEGIVEMSPEEVAEDFADALESWADWCDRDSVRLDSLDEVKAAIARAA